MTAVRIQRFRCRDCGRQFQQVYQYRACMPGTQEEIVSLTMNGCGIRDITRVLGVTINSILAALRRAADKLGALSLPERVTHLEIDEMWSFVGSKQDQYWLWYAFEPETKQILAWQCGRRTDESCQKLLDQLKSCRVMRYCTDNWESYQNLVPASQHWIGKQWTQRIERHNLNFRTHLKRLHRKTICFSKSKKMHDAVIKIYVNYLNRFQHHF